MAGAQSDRTHKGKAGQEQGREESRGQGRAAGNRAERRADSGKGKGQAGTGQDGYCRAELSRGQMEQGRAGERARWTGKGKAGRCFLPLTWMVVDLNIMSCPSVPTLGMYSRMILHPNSYMLCTYHDETGSCTHKVQLCLKQHTNFSLKEIVSSVLVLR